MDYMDTVYHYWDLIVWFSGRCLFWVIILIAVGLFLCWLIESVIEPACGAIKSAWWNLTNRCPECSKGDG